MSVFQGLAPEDVMYYIVFKPIEEKGNRIQISHFVIFKKNLK
jgi:hypothetical protein